MRIFDGGEDDETKCDMLKAGLNTLSKRKDILERAHKEYIETLSIRSEKETESEWILQAIQEHDRIHGKANEFISRNERYTKGVKEVSRNIKVEGVRFEMFDGDLRSYGRFKEEFIKHIKPAFKLEEEAFVLKSHLTKEVREEVVNLGEDAVAIWERLADKYGNKRKCLYIVRYKEIKS